MELLVNSVTLFEKCKFFAHTSTTATFGDTHKHSPLILICEYFSKKFESNHRINVKRKKKKYQMPVQMFIDLVVKNHSRFIINRGHSAAQFEKREKEKKLTTLTYIYYMQSDNHFDFQFRLSQPTNSYTFHIENYVFVWKVIRFVCLSFIMAQKKWRKAKNIYYAQCITHTLFIISCCYRWKWSELWKQM